MHALLLNPSTTTLDSYYYTECYYSRVVVAVGVGGRECIRQRSSIIRIILYPIVPKKTIPSIVVPNNNNNNSVQYVRFFFLFIFFLCILRYSQTQTHRN